MGLDDFEKISDDVGKKKNSKKIHIVDDGFKLKDIKYYLSHMDELVESVRQSHYDYVNAKIRYESKRDYHQTTINWSEENALRQSNNLPKVTTQDQRNAVVNLKVESLKVEMKSCELKYKMLNKIFNLIDNNLDMLLILCDNGSNSSLDELLDEINDELD